MPELTLCLIFAVKNKQTKKNTSKHVREHNFHLFVLSKKLNRRTKMKMYISLVISLSLVLNVSLYMNILTQNQKALIHH